MHVGHVSHPDAIRPRRRRDRGHPVGRDRLVVPAIRGKYPVAPLLTATQASCAHEAGYAVPADPLAQILQIQGNPRAAIGAPRLGVDNRDLGPQDLIALRPRRRLGLQPGIVAATGDREDLAQSLHGIRVAHRFDPGIPLGDGSERMPAAFFKMSLCSVIRTSSSCRRTTSAWSASLLSGGRRNPAARVPSPSRPHLYRLNTLIPSCRAVTSAACPLVLQSRTASRRYASSNFRGVAPDCFFAVMVESFFKAQRVSVKSGQPHQPLFRLGLNPVWNVASIRRGVWPLCLY